MLQVADMRHLAFYRPGLNEERQAPLASPSAIRQTDSSESWLADLDFARFLPSPSSGRDLLYCPVALMNNQGRVIPSEPRDHLEVRPASPSRQVLQMSIYEH